MAEEFNPTHDLQLAIERLELFAAQNPLDRTIHLAKRFIAAQFSSKVREQQKKEHYAINQEMQRAVAIVKSNYLLIQKLNRGTSEQQALAKSAMQAVQRYNTILDKTRKRPPTWSERISQYLYKKCGLKLDVEPLHIPEQASVQKNYSSKKVSTNFISSKTKASFKKIVSFMEDAPLSEEPILKHEEEAFRVKAISLLRSHGIRFTSASEEFLSIRSTPMQATKQDHKRVLISQILKPFPGETIEFKGEFEREECSLKSAPIAHSFEVSTKSDQTGFPHPSQHTGWALSDLTIPPCPYHLERIPLFQKSYAKKQMIAKNLLPEGSLIERAKELLRKKKAIFEKNSSSLLQKHAALNRLMIASYRKTSLTEIEQSIIHTYFKSLEEKKYAYEHHCEVQELILFMFIARPYEKIQEEWLNPQKLMAMDTEARQQKMMRAFNFEMEKVLQELLQNERFIPYKATFDYMALMGSVISSSASVIILQHLSEMLDFPPPVLSDFDLKMQTALYQQLLAFHTELEENKIALIEQLETDISIFQADSFDEIDLPAKEIVKELKVYYRREELLSG